MNTYAHINEDNIVVRFLGLDAFSFEVAVADLPDGHDLILLDSNEEFDHFALYVYDPVLGTFSIGDPESAPSVGSTDHAEGAEALALAKEAKWTEVKLARDAQEFGTVSWSGNTFNADAVSQQRVADAALDALMATMASLSWSKEWTLADDSVITLSAADMGAVFQAMRGNVQAAHDTARSLRADIDAALTVEDVEAISWP